MKLPEILSFSEFVDRVVSDRSAYFHCEWFHATTGGVEKVKKENIPEVKINYSEADALNLDNWIRLGVTGLYVEQHR